MLYRSTISEEIKIMKFLKKLSCAAAVALSFTGAAHAGVVLNNWAFNPVGGGFSGAQTINEYLDVNGNAFIQLTPTGGTSFSFTEHAAFNISQADSNGMLFPITYAGGNITATFEAFGTGNFSGAFTFAGGTIRMYQNPTNGQYSTTNGMFGADLGNEIATFDVLAGGGGNVNANGSPVNNGQVTVFAKASAPGGLDAGYFFRSNGKDLSAEDILSFAFTNANTVGAPTANMVSEIACQFSGYCAADAGTNTNGHFFVSNNGQFKLAEVPEPGSLALFGIAMLGAGVTLRKRSNKA
jgi:hypothetical protein